VEVYTHAGATTPQIPLWGAFGGECAGRFAPRTTLWKTAAHLQSVLLAGEGDLWVGHVDGFARARARGAPVVLLAVTGWRKFALVSADPAVSGFADFAGGVLPYAPTGCPSVPVLHAILGSAADRIEFRPYEPRQLALALIEGRERSALLPEPLVTVLLGRVDGLVVVTNVEDEYARISGGRARMPIAGIAVHEAFLRRHPDAVGALAAGILGAAARLADHPDAAPAVLPDAFAEVVDRGVVRASLMRDIILAEPAARVRPEIERYLRIVVPELDRTGGAPDDAFFYSVSHRPTEGKP
jgi:NitT/TauT family transport system substrate-binding protein